MSAVGAGSPEIDAEVDIEDVEGETWVLLGAGFPEIDAEVDIEALEGITWVL